MSDNNPNNLSSSPVYSPKITIKKSLSSFVKVIAGASVFALSHTGGNTDFKEIFYTVLAAAISGALTGTINYLKHLEG